MIELYKELLERDMTITVEPYHGGQGIKFEFHKNGFKSADYFTRKDLYERSWMVEDALIQDIGFFDMAVADEEKVDVKKEVELFKDISEKVAIKKKGPEVFTVDKGWRAKLRHIVKFM